MLENFCCFREICTKPCINARPGELHFTYNFCLIICPRKPTLQRKSHLCIPLLEIVRRHSQFYIHVSVGDFYIPRIRPHIWLQQNLQTDPGNI